MIHSSTRSKILLAFAGVIAAYVRNYLQYHRYSFESIWEFFGFWFVHYIVIGLICAMSYGLSGWADRVILGKDKKYKSLTVDEASVYFSIVIIVSCVAVFVIAHWPAGLGDTFE